MYIYAYACTYVHILVYVYVYIYVYVYAYMYIQVHTDTHSGLLWWMGLLTNFLQSIRTTVLNYSSICNFGNKTSYSIYYSPYCYFFQRLEELVQEELVLSQFNGNSVKKSFKSLSLCVFVSTNFLLPIAILFKPCIEGQECGGFFVAK